MKIETELENVTFARRWKIARDGFGLERDDEAGNYVHIDDALDVLHKAALAAETQPIDLNGLVKQIDALYAKATPGDWARGDFFGRCLTMHKHNGADCDYRAHWYDSDHHIYGGGIKEGDVLPRNGVPSQMVAGTWDYEFGGIRKKDDADFISAIHNAWPRIRDAIIQTIPTQASTMPTSPPEK